MRAEELANHAAFYCPTARTTRFHLLMHHARFTRQCVLFLPHVHGVLAGVLAAAPALKRQSRWERNRTQRSCGEPASRHTAHTHAFGKRCCCCWLQSPRSPGQTVCEVHCRRHLRRIRPAAGKHNPKVGASHAPCSASIVRYKLQLFDSLFSRGDCRVLLTNSNKIPPPRPLTS